MRKFVPAFLLLFFVFNQLTAQNVGIGTNTPQSSAILDVSSTDKGFLPPRMTTAQRNAIANKVAGLLIYNTNSNCVEMYNGAGWISLCTSLPSSVLPKSLLGGNNDDRSNFVIQTLDSGYVFAGSTESSEDGDVTGTNNAGIDCWVVKMSKTGVIEWNKVMGGTFNEQVNQIRQTADGGYVFCASTESSASGDVTGDNHGPIGTLDYWVVKLDAAGNVSWDVILGGNLTEVATSIVQTADGGYVVGGHSSSSANGDVTPVNHSTNTDCWIVKLTAAGVIQWNVLLGGTGEEELQAIRQTTDGGYIATGSTTLAPSGNVSGTINGTFDFWVIKLTSIGGITWNKVLGGSDEEFSYDVQQTADGGYIVAGNSNSAASGNISVSTHGDFDYLIMKLDASGNTVWNKMLGGTSVENVSAIKQTADGGYIVAGTTASSASGNITDTGYGLEDAWIVKLDASGNIVWNRLFGGTNADFATSIQQTFDGGYIFTGYTMSSASGTISGINHDPSGNSNDFWVTKLDANGVIQ
ncbi:MAG: T9SS C-terminal target domain-containing protein [Chitinophagaceae bacterium]|nr:MAG: T9SS C-terminal target domain-containing protein [Chitinophagaceae bacterium]